MKNVVIFELSNKIDDIERKKNYLAHISLYNKTILLFFNNLESPGVNYITL